MIEHLTYNQMAEKYPDQWIGINNIKYIDDDGVTIESADVIFTDKSKEELFDMQIIDGSIEVWYTTDIGLDVGMAEVM